MNDRQRRSRKSLHGVWKGHSLIQQFIQERYSTTAMIILRLSPEFLFLLKLTVCNALTEFVSYKAHY